MATPPFSRDVEEQAVCHGNSVEDELKAGEE